MDIDERMLEVERQTVINKTRVDMHQNDIDQLFTLLRNMMTETERRDKQLIELITSVDSKLNSQRSFWAGIVFTVGGIGTTIVLVANWVVGKT